MCVNHQVNSNVEFLSHERQDVGAACHLPASVPQPEEVSCRKHFWKRLP